MQPTYAPPQGLPKGYAGDFSRPQNEEIVVREDFGSAYLDTTPTPAWIHADGNWEAPRTNGTLSSVSVAGRLGIIRLGAAAVSDYICALRRYDGQLSQCAYMKYEATVIAFGALPGSTDKFIPFFGMSSSATGDIQSSGLHLGFLLDYDIDNTPKWICRAQNGASKTDQVTDITAGTGSWNKLRIEYDGTDAKFYIDDVLKATISTNLPVGTMKLIAASIRKVLGTSSRFYQIDSLQWVWRSTSR